MSNRSVDKRLDDLEAAAGVQAGPPAYYDDPVFGRLEVGRPLALVWDVDYLDPVTRARCEAVNHDDPRHR